MVIGALGALGASAVAAKPAKAASLAKFSLPPFDGLLDQNGAPARGFSSADLEKRKSVIVFFGSWCPACREEHGAVWTLARMNVAPVYGAAVNDEARDLRRFFKERGNPFAAVGDDREENLAEAVGIESVPYILITGPGPKALLRYDEGLDEEDLKKKILPALLGDSI